MRWVHRSTFFLRPPQNNAPIPIAGEEDLFIHTGWYGVVVVEAEGTNEGLADLQDRCKGAFPPRAGADSNKPGRRVFRLLRERR